MSFFEFLLISVIAIFFLKKEDARKIFKFIKEMQNKFVEIQRDVYSYLDLEENKLDNDDAEEINDYLKKISDVGGVYQGQYDIKHIKKHYHRITRNQSKQQTKEK